MDIFKDIFKKIYYETRIFKINELIKTLITG